MDKEWRLQQPIGHVKTPIMASFERYLVLVCTYQVSRFFSSAEEEPCQVINILEQKKVQYPYYRKDVLRKTCYGRGTLPCYGYVRTETLLELHSFKTTKRALATKTNVTRAAGACP